MIQLKGNRGREAATAYLINPSAIELVEIGLESTVVVTAHAKITVPTAENLDTLQRLSAGPIDLAEELQVYPF